MGEDYGTEWGNRMAARTALAGRSASTAGAIRKDEAPLTRAEIVDLRFYDLERRAQDHEALLAALLNRAGVEPATVEGWRRAQTRPDRMFRNRYINALLDAIARAKGRPPKQLLRERFLFWCHARYGNQLDGDIIEVPRPFVEPLDGEKYETLTVHAFRLWVIGNEIFADCGDHHLIYRRRQP